MWPVPAPVPQEPLVILTSEFDSPIRSSVDSFFKDDREIRVGDCALFQAGNAPPFIGIIRWFTTTKEDCLQLCVNWLYRPADIKLTKGVLLEASPNEVFYSFHKDVISAASLLHPCKVSFLGKGVELPLGISSFICRRVYDIANKCLWWLTDQDYINERQEEVDQLLYKTRLEMHAAVHSDGRSPKLLNDPSSTPLIKSGTDSVQNCGTSFPSQVKGKKRERGGDQGTEPIKRERPTKLEDGESASSRLDSMIKAEIAKITEKRALITTDGVEKLVHLIQLDRNERKIDLAGRILLADLIAATDKIECLARFVQLRGVPVLDDWLQGAHRGKTGDGSSPKDTDKGADELLLALLRALDKLPVNLNALQTCNIGKSVNHLRGHKNIEIQKKARNLIDTWKKRVDAEMTKINDAKSGGSNQAVAWPAKHGFPEVSHAGSRQSGSAETTMKNPINQTSMCKTLVGKPGHTDPIVKSTPVTLGSLKLPLSLPTSVPISSKDSPGKGTGSSGNSEVPLVVVKEEKSTSSSQSQNNSQSYSSDHANAMNSSWKEDARSSTAGSLNANKASGGSYRHRRSTDGYMGSSISGAQKEANLGKTGSLNKVSYQSGLSSERTFDTQGVDHGSSHRLIVRLPNPGRSPARSASGGYLEDPSVPGSRASSSGPPDKYDQIDRKIKLKGEACRSHISTDVNEESWQSNDVKEGVVGCDEGERSPATVLDEERRGADETGRVINASRAACLSAVNGKGVVLTETKSRNSFSSMNALIESCAKYSEACASLSSGDDVGINLLANVAAGEISKSDLLSSASPGSSPKEEPCAVCDEAKSRFMGEDGESADLDSAEHGKSVGVLVRENLEQASMHSSGDGKITSLMHENKLTNIKEGLEGKGGNRSTMVDNNTIDYTCEKIAEGSTKASNLADYTLGDGGDTDTGTGKTSEKLGVEESSLSVPLVKEVPYGATLAEQRQPPVTENYADATDKIVHDEIPSSNADEVPCSEIADSCRIKISDELKGTSLDSSDSARNEQTGPVPSSSTLLDEKFERKEVLDEAPSSVTTQDSDKCAKSIASNLSRDITDKREEISSSAEALSVLAPYGPGAVTKLDFDLNEGLSGDDINLIEHDISSAPVYSPAIHLPNRSPFTISSISSGLRAPITVAAPAKGPFVLPENLMKSKGEPGWKGSAVTSAFRPAEPRRVLEMPLNTSDLQSGKLIRPPLDIDLNVPDERVLEDLASQSSHLTTRSESGAISNRNASTQSFGGLDLDLNKADEGTDNGQLLASTCSRLEVPLMSTKRFPNREENMFRDFDLNNGPAVDEVGADTLQKSQHPKNCSSSMPFLPQISSLRMGNADLGNVSSWFPHGNSYPAVAMPSFLADRGEQQPYPFVALPGTQRILGSVAGGGGTSGGDIYRGPVLSSSPAMAFPSTTTFPYAAFPFVSTFPLTSTSFPGGPTTYADSTGAASCFSAIPSMGPGGVVSSHFVGPYMVSLQEGSTNVISENSRKWGRQGLDLNVGPGSADVKDGWQQPSALRQLPIGSVQAFMDEQARMYQMSGGGIKRKEREAGSRGERFCKHPSWQ